MRVLEAKSDDESLKFFMGIKKTERGTAYEFFYRYSSRNEGKTITVVSEKETYKSLQTGFRIVAQEVLALLSSKRSKLDISAITGFQNVFMPMA